MTYHRVLIPIMGNSCDRHAIELAASVADQSSPELSLVYVVEVAQEYPLEANLPEELERGERALEAAETIAGSVFNGKRPRIRPELLQARSAGAAIVGEAEHLDADVIVMALRNLRRHGRPTVGETVPYVLKNAPCEVIIRRQPPRDGNDRCDWAPEISEPT